MFGVKTDFGMMGRLFGVPRAWLSRVGAFCTFWRVESPIIKLVVPDFPNRDNPIRLGVDADALAEAVSDSVNGSMGNPVVNTGIGTLETPGVSLTGVTNWTSGGANGVRLQVFVAGRDNYGASALFPAHLDITNRGTIQSITFLTTTAFVN